MDLVRRTGCECLINFTTVVLYARLNINVLMKPLAPHVGVFFVVVRLFPSSQRQASLSREDVTVTIALPATAAAGRSIGRLRDYAIYHQRNLDSIDSLVWIVELRVREGLVICGNLFSGKPRKTSCSGEAPGLVIQGTVHRQP